MHAYIYKKKMIQYSYLCNGSKLFNHCFVFQNDWNQRVKVNFVLLIKQNNNNNDNIYMGLYWKQSVLKWTTCSLHKHTHIQWLSVRTVKVVVIWYNILRCLFNFFASHSFSVEMIKENQNSLCFM